MPAIFLATALAARLCAYEPGDRANPAFWSLAHENECAQPLRRFRFRLPPAARTLGVAASVVEWFRTESSGGERPARERALALETQARAATAKPGAADDGSPSEATEVRSVYTIAGGRHRFGIAVEWPSHGQAFLFTTYGEGFALGFGGEPGAEFFALAHRADCPAQVDDEGRLVADFREFEHECRTRERAWFDRQFGLDTAWLAAALEAGALGDACSLDADRLARAARGSAPGAPARRPARL
jgi:hypothetical protein